MKQGQMKRTWCLFLLLVMTTAAFAGEFIRAPGPKVPGEYMVVFMNDVRAIDEASALANVHAATVAQLWEHALNGALFTSMSEAAAQALARNPHIAWVEENGIATIVATQTQNPTPSSLRSQLPTFFHLWAVRKGGRLYVFSFQRPTDWGTMIYTEPPRSQDSLQPLEMKEAAEMWVTVTLFEGEVFHKEYWKIGGKSGSDWDFLWHRNQMHIIGRLPSLGRLT